MMEDHYKLLGSISLSVRSTDLSPLDFFLWGYAKDKVYKSVPGNIGELKKFIQKFFQKVQKSTDLDLWIADNHVLI